MFTERWRTHFPEQAEVPETKRHLELRTLVYQFLKLEFAGVGAIGCDQFVYWDAADARACLAPDAFVCLGTPDDLFRSWKVWERGAPDVAVEIISESDQPSWDEKLARYRRLGVRELVWFDSESEGCPLRIWDLVAGELLERALSKPCAYSHHLGGYWLAVNDASLGLALRLSHDPLGAQLFSTPAEREAEARRLEAAGRRAAEQRVLELEAELRRR